MTDHKPIDDHTTVPPQTGQRDPDTITADVEKAFRDIICGRIESVAKVRHIGLRAAAAIVLQDIRAALGEP